MKKQNPKIEKNWDNSINQFQSNGEFKQSISFEISPITIENNWLNILEVKRW
jgi:hypothetical protein